MEKALENVDKKLSVEISHKSENLRSQILELDTNTTSFIGRTEEHLAEMQAKLNKMKEAEVIEKYARDQDAAASAQLRTEMESLDKKINSRINNLLETHLLKKNMIGPGEGCEFKTLMDYTFKKNESIQKETFKQKQLIGKAQFDVNKLKGVLDESVNEKLPAQINEVKTNLTESIFATNKSLNDKFDHAVAGIGEQIKSLQEIID